MNRRWGNYAVRAGLSLVFYAIVALFFLAYPMVRLLDSLFSTYLTPSLPQFMWGLWGALAGSVVGLHIIAPGMGLQKTARTSLWTVLAVMLVLAVIGFIIK